MEGRPSPLIAPVASGLGIQITRTTVMENILDPKVQIASLKAFLSRYPDVDLVFPVMDTSVEARALGCPSKFKGSVPVITGHPYSTPQAIAGLAAPDPMKNLPMRTNIEIVTWLCRESGKKTVAFVVGPLTLAAHLIDIKELVRLTVKEPGTFDEILSHCLRFSKPYAAAYADAGVSSVAILEPQVGFFSPAIYERSIRSKIEDLARTLPSPILHVCGNTTRHLASLAGTHFVDGLSLDASVDFAGSLEKIPELSSKILMGNISPMAELLQGTPESIRERTQQLIVSMKGRHFILSSGCDMAPDTPLENLDAFMDAARAMRHWSLQQHARILM